MFVLCWNFSSCRCCRWGSGPWGVSNNGPGSHWRTLFDFACHHCGGSGYTIWGWWVTQNGGATSQFLSACCESDPTRPSVLPASIAGMWDMIQQDHVFRSWPPKDPHSAGETVMLSSCASCVEFLTDSLVARCDCSAESVFIVLQFFFLGWRDDFYYLQNVPSMQLRDNMLYFCAVLSDCYQLILCTSEGTRALLDQRGSSCRHCIFLFLMKCVCAPACWFLRVVGNNIVEPWYSNNGDSIATWNFYWSSFMCL